MKTLLLGAHGQLGRSFAKSEELLRWGRVVLATRDGTMPDMGYAEVADLSDSKTLVALLDRVKPELIINAAAYTAVDRAEREEALATVINGEAPGVLGRWAAANGALVVHYSTDYVFDGSGRTPYAVDDNPAPLNAYGRSKLAGERALRESGAQHFIFRTAWVYSAYGNNFLRTVLRLAGEHLELKIVGDQFGTPTSTNLIVNASVAALAVWQRTPPDQRRSLTGTHHLVANGVTTWHGFATAIIEEAVARGILQAPAPRIVPIGTEGYPTPAKRPAWSVLDSSGFSQQFGVTLPDWRLGLDTVINELYLEANGKSC
jgi:dTDP-4-dehydrorhamnose reductase